METVRIIIRWYCLLFAGVLAGEPVRGNTVFRAGVSKVNITPFLGGEIVGNSGTPKAAYIHDDLHARCLVLDDGVARIIFIVADNISLGREVYDEAKRLINQRTGVPVTNMLFSSTHTHSATSGEGEGIKRRAWTYEELLDEYQRFVAGRMADAVDIACVNLKPARIGWGAVSVPQHVFNRRWKMKQPVVSPFGERELVLTNPGHLNPNLAEPAGPVDPDVSFISVRDLDGRPIAILANYSLHYVGNIPLGHVSADYFGAFADRISKLLDNGSTEVPFVAMMSNGTSGDINNRDFSKPASRHAPYEKIAIVADDVARAVWASHEEIEYRNWVKLRAAQSELKLRVRKAPRGMLRQAAKTVSRPVGSKPVFHRSEYNFAERIIRLDREWPDQIDVLIQAFRIGDLGIAAIPFEVFAETGLTVKRNCRFNQCFTISFANGAYGYLPTPQQHRMGGYETWYSSSRVQEDASDRILDTLDRLFEQLLRD